MHCQRIIKIPEKQRAETSRSLRQIQDGSPVTDNQQEIIEIMSLSKPENPEFEKITRRLQKLPENGLEEIRTPDLRHVKATS